MADKDDTNRGSSTAAGEYVQTTQRDGIGTGNKNMGQSFRQTADDTRGNWRSQVNFGDMETQHGRGNRTLAIPAILLVAARKALPLPFPVAQHVNFTESVLLVIGILCSRQFLPVSTSKVSDLLKPA